MDISCPKCRATLRVPPDLLGKKVRCSKCQAIVATPTVDVEQIPVVLPSSTMPRNPRRDEEDEEDERPSRRRAKTGATSVQLFRRETEEDRIPRVCIYCGERANKFVQKSFSWHPSWVSILIIFGLLPYVIVAVILTRSMTVDMPFCPDHRSYFTKRLLLKLFSFFGIVFLCAGMCIGAAMIFPGQDATVGFAVLFGILMLLVWAIGLIVYDNYTIKPSEITDRTITFTNIHRKFKAAVEGKPRKGLENDEEYDDEDR